uniref:Uncharacterized protein n=1 Tax=Romanomermis culicivorax TaxID=13658 RepID=A0A915K732_ROMCU
LDKAENFRGFSDHQKVANYIILRAQIPFTFELQDFKAPQRVHFDPDGCGQTFYLSFHTELEMEDDGGIKNESGTILRLSFKRGSQGGSVPANFLA